MEKEKTKKSTKTTSRKSEVDIKDKLKDAYIEYVLLNGHEPASVFQFTKQIKTPEGEFYQYFNSFKALEKEIWQGFFEVVVNKLEADEMYKNYSAREKLLAFYFTWIEVLKNNRSYVLYNISRTSKSEINPDYLKTFRHSYIEYVKSLLEEARENQEIVDRKFISDRYQEGLWLQLLFVLRFWSEDDSLSFEKTDAAIEKAVNLSFELMGRGPLESIVDFAKFIYQNKR